MKTDLKLFGCTEKDLWVDEDGQKRREMKECSNSTLIKINPGFQEKTFQPLKKVEVT